MLENTFIELAKSYTSDKNITAGLWSEIELNYSQSNRYYHTLNHLTNMLHALIEVEGSIQNRKVVLFALFYHDIIYNPLRKNNEEKSAALCAKRMKEILVDDSSIESCKKLILATKKHAASTDNDTNIFTDADLCILGANQSDYAIYSRQIRKEYSIYPDLIYNAGRKKVIQHFLAMKRIYKTDFFFQKFEIHARQNLQWELEQL